VFVAETNGDHSKWLHAEDRRKRGDVIRYSRGPRIAKHHGGVVALDVTELDFDDISERVLKHEAHQEERNAERNPRRRQQRFERPSFQISLPVASVPMLAQKERSHARDEPEKRSRDVSLSAQSQAGFGARPGHKHCLAGKPRKAS
jgi:hypothetical protein